MGSTSEGLRYPEATDHRRIHRDIKALADSTNIPLSVLRTQVADLIDSVLDGTVDLTDAAMAAAVGTVGSASRGAVDLRVEAKVEPIRPDGGVRAVGKGEHVHDARDHGADPTGVASSVSAINTLLSTPGVSHVLITGGTFLIDGPILLSRNSQRVTVDESAVLQVPSGYTGTVFLMDGNGVQMRGAVVSGGGRIVEAGKSGGRATVPGQWTAFHFRAVNSGVTAFVAEGVQVEWPGTAFKYEVQGNGWVNGGTIKDLRILYPRVYVETIGSTGVVSFASNTLRDLMGQGGDYTEYGLKGITGRDWLFDSVAFWDFHNNPTAVSAHIASTAECVTIIGGTLTTRNFTNDAPPGEVTVIDRTRVKPWLHAVGRGAGELVKDASLAGTATFTHKSNVPVWSLPDSGFSGVVGHYRVPPGCKRIQVDALVANLSAATGAARLTIATYRSADGVVLGSTPQSSNVDWTAGGDGVLSTVVGPLANVTSGEAVSVRVYRSASHTNDTLAGDMAVVGLRITPAA